MMTQTAANYEVKVGADGKITCAGTSNITSKHHYETADRIDMNGPPAAKAGDTSVPTRVPKRGSWTGQENKNPLEHTPTKTNANLEEIKKGNANKTSDDKSKDKKPEDTFKQCQVPAGNENAGIDGPAESAAAENKNATLVDDFAEYQAPAQVDDFAEINTPVQVDDFGGTLKRTGTAKLVGDAT